MEKEDLRKGKAFSWWDMARYIGRYVKHPPIAESRITAYDGKQVTFWYKDTKTGQKITVTTDKFELVHRLLSHIPENNFKIVRYIGLYFGTRLRESSSIFNMTLYYVQNVKLK